METSLQNGFGKCPACNAWNTFYEEKITKDKSTGGYKKIESSEMIKLNEVQINTYARQKTNYSELDRVLGGGLVQGSLILLGGEPRNWKIYFDFTNMRKYKR